MVGFHVDDIIMSGEQYIYICVCVTSSLVS